MSVTWVLMMALLAQADGGTKASRSAAEARLQQIFGASKQAPAERRERPLGCRAVLLSREGFQFASEVEVSRTHPMPELSNRLKTWRTPGSSPSVVVFAREHRLEARTVETVVAAVRRAGFSDASTYPGYVAPGGDDELEALQRAGCADGKFAVDIGSLAGRPGAIDLSIVDAVDAPCEDLRPKLETLEAVVELCEATRHLNPDDAASFYAQGCAEIPLCAQGCAEGLTRVASRQGAMTCEPFVKAARRVPSSLRRLAENVWVFERVLCVVDAAQRDAVFGSKVRESCSNHPLLEDIRRQVQKPKR